MRTTWICLAGAALLLGLSGCVSVKAPERIDIGGSKPPPVDSGRVPQPATLEEAQRELDRAYQNIEYLERENAKLDKKAREYKRERDEARDRAEHGNNQDD